MQRVEVQRLGPLDQPAHGRREPELIGNLRGRYDSRALPVRIRGEGGGALQSGAGDGNRAAPLHRTSMVFQGRGDRLIWPIGRHRPMPQPALGVIHDGGQGGIGCLDLCGSSGLPNGRADQRVTKAHFALDNFDERHVHRGFQHANGHGILLKRPHRADDFFERDSTVERGHQQRGAGDRRQIV